MKESNPFTCTFKECGDGPSPIKKAGYCSRVNCPHLVLKNPPSAPKIVEKKHEDEYMSVKKKKIIKGKK